MNDVKDQRAIGGRSKKPYWTRDSCACTKPWAVGWKGDCPIHGREKPPRFKMTGIILELWYERDGIEEPIEISMLGIKFADEYNQDFIIYLEMDEAGELNSKLMEFFLQ